MMSSNQTRSKAEDEQVLLFLPCLSRGLAQAGNQGYGTGGCVLFLYICMYVGIKIYIHTYTYMQTETVFLKKCSLQSRGSRVTVKEELGNIWL